MICYMWRSGFCQLLIWAKPVSLWPSVALEFPAGSHLMFPLRIDRSAPAARCSVRTVLPLFSPTKYYTKININR